MLSTRIRSMALVAGMAAVVAPVALASASPAVAQGGKPTCVLLSSTTYPGITTKQTFPVAGAGTVTIKRDAVNDGLVVGKVVAKTGWSKSVEIGAGPKVNVQFHSRTTKIELEAAQSAAYYGPDVLVVEIKSCS